MDEFGSGHDQSILDAVSAESQQLAKEHECESTADNKPGEVDKESDDLSDGNTKCFPRFPHFEILLLKSQLKMMTSSSR